MNHKLLITAFIILASASLSAQNKFEIGVNYSPRQNLMSVDDGPNMLYKFGAYGEYRWDLSKHFVAGARLDAKVGPLSPYLINDDAIAISGDLLAVIDFNLFPGKTVNPYIGFGLGPGFGMDNNTFDHLFGGTFLVYADARLGIELFRHLRLSVDYSLPYWRGSFPAIFTTLNANIGWVF
ncbi:MAG: hypothetical protein IKZ51_04860 [Bacteroidales bacterium]|nr:hypothetical protein [Bacteroidales bacterium]